MSQQEKSLATESAVPDNAEIEYIVKVKKRSLFSRVGCLIAIIVWFFILLLPIFFFILAGEGEINISHSGDVPDKFEHPLLRFVLISEIDQETGDRLSGIIITNSTVDRDGDTNLCIETHVRFLMWDGEGAPATYHDLYTRESEDAEWIFVSQNEGSCP